MTALPGKPASNSVESRPDLLAGVSPGERLQRARKEHNLEVGEMAQRLNLSPGVVRALEADDYRMLPNATFVKGYLRSYARALDISGDDLVRAYEAITGCNQPVKVEPIAAPMISDTRRNQRMVLLLLVVLVLAGVGYWLIGSQESSVASGESPAAGVAAQNEQAHAEASSQSVNPPVVVTRPLESDADIMKAAESMEEPLDEAPVVSAPQSPSAEPVAPSEVAAPQVQTVSPPEASDSVPAPAVQSEPAIAPAPSSSAPVPVEPAPVTAGGSGLLNLRFQGECWVEVRDGSGRMVFSSLKRAGEEVNLPVTPPIHVKLGNGDVVNVTYNHQPVSFATRPDRKVVRLSLGE